MLSYNSPGSSVMQKNEGLWISATHARVFGSILAFVATATLAMQLWEWWHQRPFRLRDLAMPIGATALALAHLLAPGNRKVYQLASILFAVVMIVALLLSFLGH